MMPPLVHLATVILVALSLGGMPTPLPAHPDDLVVIDENGPIRLVDAATGEDRGTAGEFGSLSSVVVGAGGALFVAVAGPAARSTDVYALASLAGSPELIGRAPGQATVAGVSADGERLRLLDRPPWTAGLPVPPPIGVRDLPLPDRWRGVAPGAWRDGGFGIVSPDGSRWYELRSQETRLGTPNGGELRTVSFHQGAPPSSAVTSVPLAGGYYSLLLAPDGQTLYAVDYYGQTVFVLDAGNGKVERSIAFGDVPFKRPLCAATLSPAGDRLYVLANSGSTHAGNGILVYDTGSWRRVRHVVPGEDLYCLTVSPDGNRLFASRWIDRTLLTIDARTGRELGRVVPRAADCCLWLLGVVTPS